MLRNLELKDAKPMLDCLKDPKVNLLMNIDGSKMTIFDCEKFIKSSLESNNHKHFAITDNYDKWVGTISLKNIDLNSKTAEYAIITASNVHGTGISYLSTMEILNYGFNVLKLEKVYLNVVKDNERANKFYQKCGFKYEGCFKNHIYIKGKIYDLLWYAILKNEFEDNEK